MLILKFFIAICEIIIEFFDHIITFIRYRYFYHSDSYFKYLKRNAHFRKMYEKMYEMNRAVLKCKLCGGTFDCIYPNAETHIFTPNHIASVNLKVMQKHIQDLTTADFAEFINITFSDDLTPEQIQDMMPFFKSLNGRIN